MTDLTIIKVGTGVLTKNNGSLDGGSLVKLVTAISELVLEGHRCLLVSSGAVGAGVPVLGLRAYPEDVETRQAAAAVGQTRLMHSYQKVFELFGIVPAQVLLTRSDLETEKRRARILQTLDRLLKEDKIVPIVNENDSVAVNELRIGDNDVLSARVAVLTKARRLVLLSTVDGLQDERGEVLREVDDLEGVMGLARKESGKFSMGGMASKLEAVKRALDGGVPVTIGNGKKPECLRKIFAEAGGGTSFTLP